MALLLAAKEKGGLSRPGLGVMRSFLVGARDGELRGVLAIIRQLKAEHKAEVNKIEAEHDHQTTLARIDNLQLVVDLMDDIHKMEKEHQEAILGYAMCIYTNDSLADFSR